jgi:hypothetical protein
VLAAATDRLRDLLIDRHPAGVAFIQHLGPGQHVRHTAVVAVATWAEVARLHVEPVEYGQLRAERLELAEHRAERARTGGRARCAAPHALGDVNDDEARWYGGLGLRAALQAAREHGGDTGDAEATEESTT